jgi:hypothetical protein
VRFAHGARQLQSWLDNVGSIIRGAGGGRGRQCVLAETVCSPAHH